MNAGIASVSLRYTRTEGGLQGNPVNNVSNRIRVLSESDAMYTGVRECRQVGGTGEGQAHITRSGDLQLSLSRLKELLVQFRNDPDQLEAGRRKLLVNAGLNPESIVVYFDCGTKEFIFTNG